MDILNDNKYSVDKLESHFLPLSTSFNLCSEYKKKIEKYNDMLLDKKYIFYTNCIDNPYKLLNSRTIEFNNFIYLEDELINISNVDNYYINFISNAIIEQFTEIVNILTINYPNDEENLRKINENFNMMYNSLSEGVNIINIDTIKNIRSFIYLIAISLVDIKYISLLISILDIELDERVMNRQNRNLLMMSLIHDDIRISIVEKIGKTKYTEMLLKKTKLNILENNELITYIEFSFLTNNFKNILESLDYKLMSDFKYFNNNNILHLIGLLFNNQHVGESIDLTKINELESLMNVALCKNDYGLIPIEIINPNIFNKEYCDKFHIFYINNPNVNIKSFSNKSINYTPKLAVSIYKNNNDDNDELLILKHFNQFLKFYKDETTNKEDIINFIKKIYEKHFLNVIDEEYINIMPYFSPVHMSIYIEYIKNSLNKDKYNQNHLLNCEYYDIFINKDNSYKYLSELLETPELFYNLIYKRVNMNQDIRDNIYLEIGQYIKQKINLNCVKNKDIKILLMLHNISFDKITIDDKDDKDKDDYTDLYSFIIEESRKETTLNTRIIDHLLPNLINNIKSNYEFNCILKHCSDYNILFESELSLDIIFGTTIDDITYIVKNYNEFCKRTYDKTITNEYIEKNENSLIRIFIKFSGDEYTIYKSLCEIFNIDQTFFDKINIQNKLSDILTDITDYIIYKDWIETILNIIKLDKQFFTENFCSRYIIYFPYEIQKIFIEYKYINNTYLSEDHYKNIINILILNIGSQNINDLENYMNMGLIDYKYILETEIIMRVLEYIKNLTFIISNEDYKSSLKIGLNKYNGLITNKLGSINKKTVYEFGINMCFPEEFYKKTTYPSIINIMMKYIKNNNINLGDIIENLSYISKLDYEVMRYILVYIIANNTDEEIITNYLNNIDIKSIPLNEYINTFGIIENLNIFKAILNVFKTEKDTETMIIIIIANKKLFMENSVDFTYDEKLTILIDNHDKFETSFIMEFIDNIVNIKSRNINSEKLFELFSIYNLIPNEKTIMIYPELINIPNLDTQIIDKTICQISTEENIFEAILNFNGKFTEYVINNLLSNLINIDFENYIKFVLKFNNTQNIIDKDKIIDECIKNLDFFNYILKQNIFEKDLEQLIKLKNKINNYILSYCDEDTILKYLDMFSKDEMIQKNNFEIPYLFTFCSTENILIKLLEKINIEDNEIINLTDKVGRNIYSICAQFGLFQYIPENIIDYNFILKIIMNSKSDKDLIKLLEKLINTELFNQVNLENISIPIQLAKYKPSIFKTLYGGKYFDKLCEIIENININNETYLMLLIKYSNDSNILYILNKLLNTKKIKLNTSYIDNNTGSILTYSLKYSPDFLKKLINTDILKDILYELSYVYDTVDEIINPYSMNNCENNVRLNILQISAIYNVDCLRYLMKNINRKRTLHMMKEKIKLNEKYFNLLTIAICNNPESVQEIISNVLCDDKYIEESDIFSGNFEEVADIQPGSFYYLQSSPKTRKKIKLNMDYHYYGYNYKRKLTEENIKKITHYILDKQELGTKNNICEICMSYKQKVVLTKCHHKICIVCALKTKNCQICRRECDDKDKILI
jgi:hypothetical protein